MAHDGLIVGIRAGQRAARLPEQHGLYVQRTEAVAERWHARVRAELAFVDEDARDLSGILNLQHRGAR